MRSVRRREQSSHGVSRRPCEPRCRSLVSSLHAAVFSLTLDGHITGLYGELAPRGEEAEALIGRTAEDLFSASAATHRAAREQARAGRPASYECRVGQQDMEVSLAPMRDADGAIVALAGIARVITEQKELQTRLLVADRLASVGTLAAGVAHEINNPLAAVKVCLDLAAESLADGPPDAAMLKELQQVLAEGCNAVERIRKTVADLKQFSTTTTDDRLVPVDVRRVLETTLRITANEIRHRARLVRDFGEVPPVRGQEARLGQVFLNLLMNAAHAIPEGHAGEHEIRVRTSVARDGRVAVDVRDTGAGISAAVQQRLFTPYFSTRPIGSGTGLGLSVSHRIVTELGGELGVLESSPGKGTTFRVLLPPLEGVSPAAGPESRVTHEAACRRARILVIDDDESVCAAFAFGLHLEHDVDVRSNARDALALILSGQRFDVIFCDLMMPDFTGAEFVEALERSVPAQLAGVVLMTGGAFAPESRAFLERTRLTSVDKPVGLAQLRALIAERTRRQDAGD